MKQPITNINKLKKQEQPRGASKAPRSKGFNVQEQLRNRSTREHQGVIKKQEHQ